MIKSGNFDQALDEITKILRDKPKNDWFLCLKGKILEKLNRLDEAESIYSSLNTPQAIYL